MNSHLLAQKDGFRRDDGDQAGLGLSLCRREFPLAGTVGNGVVLSWFGTSQVLWVSFFGIFSVSCSFPDVFMWVGVSSGTA